jgi:hypothetical protein
MKNPIIIAFFCAGLFATATAQHTPAPSPDNRSQTRRQVQVVVVEKDTMPHPVNSSNIVNDPTIRATLQESPFNQVDDRSRADKPNANINLDATNQRRNNYTPNSTNSANPNSNAITADPAYNSRIYLDETKSVHRDHTQVVPANPATRRTSANTPASERSRIPVTVDSTSIKHSNSLPGHIPHAERKSATKQAPLRND